MPTEDERQRFEKLMESIRALTPEQRAEKLRLAEEAVDAWENIEDLADGLLASPSFRAAFLNPDAE